MKIGNIVQVGIVLIFALLCLQVIGSLITVKIFFEFEPNTILTPSGSTPRKTWHTVEIWSIGIVVGTIAYSSPNILIQRDEEPDDLDMDEDKAKRLKHILGKWSYKLKKRLHLKDFKNDF